MDDVTMEVSALFKRFRLNAPLYMRYGLRSPGWLMMFVFGRIPAVRAFVGRRSTDRSEEYKHDGPSILEIDTQAALKAVRLDGYYPGLKLPQALLGELQDIADESLRDANGAVSVVIDSLKKKGRSCHALEQLQADSSLTEIATAYLNSRPVHFRSRIWWSFARETTLEDKLEYGQALLHPDLHDYRGIKFFFYLTEVDRSAGPHVCVRGTHTHRALKHQLSPFVGHTEQDIIRHYGRENVMTICGPAGFGFVEDPFCFHRGTPPESRDRLMLEIEFVRTHYLRKNKKSSQPSAEEHR